MKRAIALEADWRTTTGFIALVEAWRVEVKRDVLLLKAILLSVLASFRGPILSPTHFATDHIPDC